MSNFLEKITGTKTLAEAFASVDKNFDFSISHAESGLPVDLFKAADSDNSGSIDLIEAMTASDGFRVNKVFSDSDIEYVSNVSAGVPDKEGVNAFLKAGFTKNNIVELYLYFGDSMFSDMEVDGESSFYGLRSGIPKYIRACGIGSGELVADLRAIKEASVSLSRQWGANEPEMRRVLVDSLVRQPAIREGNRPSFIVPECRERREFAKEVLRTLQNSGTSCLYSVLFDRNKSDERGSRYNGESFEQTSLALFEYWTKLKKDGKTPSDAMGLAAKALDKMSRPAFNAYRSLSWKLEDAGFSRADRAMIIIEWGVPQERIRVLNINALKKMSGAMSDRVKQKYIRFMLANFGAYLLNNFNLDFKKIGSWDQLSAAVAAGINRIYSHYTGRGDSAWVKDRTGELQKAYKEVLSKDPAFAKKISSKLSPKAKERLGIL